MSEAVDLALIDSVRRALAEAADPERAAGQQAYMKSTLPFHGITSAQLTRLLRPIFAEQRLTDRAAWESTIRIIWDEATHREQRYAALALAGHRSYRQWQDPDLLSLYRHLIVTGAWWDLVDALATRHVGPILADHRLTVTAVIIEWSTAGDRWLRRTAILAQLKHRSDTDTELLARVIGNNLPGSSFGQDFFIRKGIGWALREYAKTDPDWVAALIEHYGDQLSPLSRREASRQLG